MSTSDERRRILDMLAAQTITAHDAEVLLAALDATGSTAVEERPSYSYLRVKVITDGEEAVDLRIPLLLVRSGLALGSMLPAEIGAELEAALSAKRGRTVDLRTLCAADVDELLDALVDLEITAQDTVIRFSCE